MFQSTNQYIYDICHVSPHTIHDPMNLPALGLREASALASAATAGWSSTTSYATRSSGRPPGTVGIIETQGTWTFADVWMFETQEKWGFGR